MYKKQYDFQLISFYFYIRCMAFTFGKINVGSKKHVVNLKTVDKIVLDDNSLAYASYEQPVVVLADQYYNEYQVKAIKNFLEANRITRYKIITALNCIISKDQIKDDQKSGIIDFYRNNSSDFWGEIPDNALIITVGASLYALTQSDDVYPDYTHQRIFGVSHFWVSTSIRDLKNINKKNHRGNWVFPIESFVDLFAYGFSSPPVDSFKTKLAQFQFKTILRKKAFLPPRYPKIDKRFIYTREAFLEFYEENKHRENDIMAWDLETSGFNFRTDEIGCISISFDGRVGYYIRWSAVDTELLGKLLEKNIQLGANLKFDVKFLWANGVKAARIDEDVIVIGHILDETRSNSLKTLAYFYSEFGGYDWELDEYKRKTKIDNYLDIPEEILQEYALMDSIVTWRIYARIYKHMQVLDKKYPNEKGYDHNHESYYRNMRIPSANMYADIEYFGTPVNMDKLDFARTKAQGKIEELREKLVTSFGVSPLFDFNSPTKLGRLLQEQGWEDMGRAKAGHYKCGDDQLARWAEHHPEAKLIQEYRTVNVFLKTFIGEKGGGTGWEDAVQYHEEDGSYRLHAQYYPMGTESGRTRCRAPNLMNIPARGELSKDIKASIATPDDDKYYIVSIDYAALQMRLAAADGQDKGLMELFKSKRDADVHTRTSYNVFVRGKKFNIDEIEIEQDGKVYNFLGGQQVMTSNRGRVFARDINEEDTLLI